MYLDTQTVACSMSPIGPRGDETRGDERLTTYYLLLTKYIVT